MGGALATGTFGRSKRSRGPLRALSRRHALMLRQTQGAFRTLGNRHRSIRAGAINQCSRSQFWWSALTRSQLFRVRSQPACAGVAGPPRRAAAEPDPETIRLHDRAAQANFQPGGILLENQDVGGNVQRRMGKPVRRLRTLLPGKARGRGYRQNLFHPVSWKLLDSGLCACKDYQNRSDKVPDCVRLTPENVRTLNWLPPSCGYKLVAEGAISTGGTL